MTQRHGETPTSWASSAATRRSMRANRGRDTSPEKAVRSALHRLGLRYRVNTRPEPTLQRTADIVFRPSRVAVFIDGCFWHSCPTHATRPRTHSAFWNNKLERTLERDRETTDTLERAGWLVLRFWEHEDPEEVALRVHNAVIARR